MPNKDLSGLSDEDLRAELERRKAPPVPVPVQRENPDFSALRSCVVSGVERAMAEGYVDEDLRQYVYEEAVSAVYGQTFWEWRRNAKI